LLGAGSIVLLGDFLSDLWPRWLMLLGIILILVVVFMRGGLWGGLSSLVERIRGHRKAALLAKEKLL
jgi:branched-chain amino acid transport system permease protein